MRTFLIPFFAVLLFASCEKEECEPRSPERAEVPSCVLELLLAPDSPEYDQIERWVLADGVYYYLVAGCCDQYNPLYDDSCAFVCAPDGGITGEGTGECFDLPAEFERTVIWTRGE